MRFNRAITKRPVDFRRRILSYCSTPDRKDLLAQEEHWLQMINPNDLQRRYYNTKRRATGGFVTEGYTPMQRKNYIEKLRLRPGRGGNHYAARPCFCIDKTYATVTEAKRTLGWSPERRLRSRKYADFYFVDEGKPSEQEIEENRQKSAQNKKRCIEAMRQRNISLPQSYHKRRTAKTTATRRMRGFKWVKPLALRKGRKVSINGREFNNLKHATQETNLTACQIRCRVKLNDPTCFFI